MSNTSAASASKKKRKNGSNLFMFGILGAVLSTGFFSEYVFENITPLVATLLFYKFSPKLLKVILFWYLVGQIFLSASIYTVNKIGTPIKDYRGEKHTALVTGSSSGIGLDIAEELASKGFDLVLVARRKERLEELSTTFETKYKVNVNIIGEDLGDVKAAERVYNEVLARDITVDILVNNAGLGYTGEFDSMPLSSIENVISVNAISTTQLTRLFVKDMIKRGTGKIMQVSSITAFSPQPTTSVYGATKAYLASFTYALAYELEGTGVTITNLIPGATITEFSAVSNSNEALCFKYMAMSSKEVATAGVEGLLNGYRNVVPGIVNKMYVYFFADASPKYLMKMINKLAWN